MRACLLQHAGGHITFPLALPTHFGFQKRTGGRYDEERDVEYVIGAVMAIRQEVLDHVGLMDEGIFLGYYDDVDYVKGRRRAGFRVVYMPTARAVHLELRVTTQKGARSISSTCTPAGALTY